MTLVHAKCFWSGAASQQDSPTFVFTAIADQNETRLVERSRRVAEYLQSKFAMPVKYLPVKSYRAAITAFINSEPMPVKYLPVKSYRAAITAFINSEPMPTRLSEAPGEAGIGRRLGVERLPCKA